MMNDQFMSMPRANNDAEIDRLMDAHLQDMFAEANAQWDVA